MKTDKTNEKSLLNWGRSLDWYYSFGQYETCCISRTPRTPSPDEIKVTLNEIDSFYEKQFSDFESIIIVIAFSKLDFNDYYSLLNSYMFRENLGRKLLNVNWLGYYLRKRPDYFRRSSLVEYINAQIFDNSSFIEDKKKLERLTGYHIGDELGVLLLDCYHGHIRYDKSLYINIEDLARKGEGNCLERFFDVLTTACYRHKFVKDVKTELIAKMLL